jgi:hypothetical protein
MGPDIRPHSQPSFTKGLAQNTPQGGFDILHSLGGGLASGNGFVNTRPEGFGDLVIAGTRYARRTTDGVLEYRQQILEEGVLGQHLGVVVKGGPGGCFKGGAGGPRRERLTALSF